MNAGTQITMLDGSTKNVENVQKSDILLGYNYDPIGAIVLALRPKTVNEFYIINNRLRVNYEHLIMVKDKWRGTGRTDGLFKAGSLVIGDKMVRRDGTLEEITSIDVVTGETPTYNFIVTGNHLYVADDIVVHDPTVEKF